VQSSGKDEGPIKGEKKKKKSEHDQSSLNRKKKSAFPPSGKKRKRRESRKAKRGQKGVREGEKKEGRLYSEKEQLTPVARQKDGAPVQVLGRKGEYEISQRRKQAKKGRRGVNERQSEGFLTGEKER